MIVFAFSVLAAASFVSDSRNSFVGLISCKKSEASKYGCNCSFERGVRQISTIQRGSLLWNGDTDSLVVSNGIEVQSGLTDSLLN